MKEEWIKPGDTWYLRAHAKYDKAARWSRVDVTDMETGQVVRCWALPYRFEGIRVKEDGTQFAVWQGDTRSFTEGLANRESQLGNRYDGPQSLGVPFIRAVDATLVQD